MPVNGRVYDWESLSLQGPQGIMVDIEEISYEDERKLNRAYGRGSRTQGYGRGNYSGKGTLTLRREELERLEAQAPDGIYEMDPFPMSASYAAKGKDTITDKLEDCVFVNRKLGSKQDDESQKVTLDFEILGDLRLNDRLPFPEDTNGGSSGSSGAGAL